MRAPAILFFCSLAVAAAACGDDEPAGPAAPDVLLPDVSAASFVAGVVHPFFPLPPGATWAYESQTDEGLVRIDVEVLADTRDINGVEAMRVRDTETLDGVLVEDTEDWFAQDSAGNVWYLGEDTCEFADGECVSTAGSWEWGREGALPGFIMRATPTVDGQPYYQEFFEGEAEDVGEVVAVGESVTVAAGSFTACIRTHDTSTLDPELDELKTYCPGVGVVRIEEPGGVVEELVSTSGLGGGGAGPDGDGTPE